jgi:hypothetical protein
MEAATVTKERDGVGNYLLAVLMAAVLVVGAGAAIGGYFIGHSTGHALPACRIRNYLYGPMQRRP